MEPSLDTGDDEESPAETEEKRSQRRKRRRRRGGRGEASNEPAFQNGEAEHSMEAGDGDEGGDGEEPLEEGAAEGADRPGIPEETAPRNGSESDQEFRRNRRRGRRGGRRHRDELGGGAEPVKNHGEVIPGLGEQPVLNFDLHFPKNAELGPVNREPAVQEQPGAPQPESTPLAEAVSQPELSEKPENTTVTELSEAAPEPIIEVAGPAEEPVAPTPVQAPKPKPARTGPPRKGWWQRRAG